jgi:hypothetical protein
MDMVNKNNWFLAFWRHQVNVVAEIADPFDGGGETAGFR